MKEHHDAKREPWVPAVGDLVYICLHKGYQVASKIHHKLGAQRVGPFKVTDSYPNACRLALPPRWRIHPVISIEHLEKHPGSDDPFARPAFDVDLPEPSDTASHWATFESIISKQSTHKGRRTRYLLRRRGMGPAWDAFDAIRGAFDEILAADSAWMDTGSTLHSTMKSSRLAMQCCLGYTKLNTFDCLSS